jgi:hypothetical protein
MGLTLLTFSTILIIIKKLNSRKLSHTIYRQSDIHKILKNFFALEINEKEKPTSQLTSRLEKDTIKVIIFGTQAYWVSDNTFYVAEAFGGQINTETAKPVDIQNMSKTEIDKMLFILDSLQSGKVKNDRSSTGNE